MGAKKKSSVRARRGRKARRASVVDDLMGMALTEMEDIRRVLEMIPESTSLMLMAAAITDAAPPERRDSIAEAAKEHFGIDIDAEEVTEPSATLRTAMEIPDVLAEMAQWRLGRLLELLTRARRA